LGLFAWNIDDAIKNFDKIRDTVSFDIHMN
jgi:hypothetical protein